MTNNHTPGLHRFKDAVDGQLKLLPASFMEAHRQFGCTFACIPADPKPDHTYERCWVCQRRLQPAEYDPAIDPEPPKAADHRFCSDTCSIAYGEWYRRRWEREHPTRGDGTSSVSFGFEQSLLDDENERT